MPARHELVIEDDVLDAIAAEAKALGTGARGLHRLVGRAVDSVDHRWPELADEGVTRVTLDRGVIEGNAQPKLTKATTSACARQGDELRAESLRDLPPRPAPGTDRRRVDASDRSSWSSDRLRDAIDRHKAASLDWPNTAGSARKWWDAFERENESRLALVLRLCEEIVNRKATITDFFLAYVYSNTDNIQANLHDLDYTRLKKEEQKKRRRRPDGADGERGGGADDASGGGD